MQNGMERQLELYRKGLFGTPETFPLTDEELEESARKVLKPEAFDYVAGSAGTEVTDQANRKAFERFHLVPRVLCDTTKRDWSIELFGHRYETPIMVAPVGVQGILHPEGELEVARACASLGVPMVLSTVSSSPLEQVAEVMGDAPRWFQLYWSKSRELAKSFVQRAEKAGYQAIVVTVDAHTLGWRPRDLAHGYLPFMHGQGLANYFTDPVFRSMLSSPPEEDPGSAIMLFAEQFGNPSLTWNDIQFLREQVNLPILIKGILHPADAEKALEHGVDGIIVSNHGGRQVDGAIPALLALPGIVESIAGKIPVLFDSGIRTAPDAIKVLSMGTTAVLLGRPVMWSLAIGGEQSVRTYLRNFLAEFDLTLSLCGISSTKELDKSLLHIAL